MKKWIVVLLIMILVGLSFFVFSNMTGNVITGGSVAHPSIESESFRIGDFEIEGLDKFEGGNASLEDRG